MVSRSLSVDVRLSRILAAEEYLENMEQYEKAIKHLLEDTANKDENFPTVVKFLGLRVHLQDELLEIQRMLAEDDPDLSKLDEFIDSHKKVVDILRQLNELSPQSSEDTDFIPLAMYASETSTETMGTSSTGTQSSWNQTSESCTQYDAPSGVDIGMQSEAAAVGAHVGAQSVTAVGVRIGTQSEGFVTEDAATSYDIATDPDLKERYDEEERCMSMDFATKLLEVGNEKSSQDVDVLLSDHLKSAQQLRQKQEDECRSMLGVYRQNQEGVQKMKAADKEKHKQKVQEKLAQRKRQQMCNTETVDQTSSSEENTQP